MELMLLEGETREAASGSTLEVSNPATLDALESVPDATPEDAAAAMRYAADNKKRWAQTPLHERVAIIHRFIAVVQERRDELARLLTMETGKPIRESHEEVDETCAVFRAFAECVGQAMYGIATQLDLQAGLADDYLAHPTRAARHRGGDPAVQLPDQTYAHKVGPALLARQRRGGQAQRGDAPSPSLGQRVAGPVRGGRVRRVSPPSLLRRNRRRPACHQLLHPDAISMTGSTEVGIGVYLRTAPSTSPGSSWSSEATIR